MEPQDNTSNTDNSIKQTIDINDNKGKVKKKILIMVLGFIFLVLALAVFWVLFFQLGAACNRQNEGAGKRYLANSPVACAGIKYKCTKNEKPFNDRCGCGCITSVDVNKAQAPKEDTWICSDGGWIKHGNPVAPKPSGICYVGDKYIAEGIIIDVDPSYVHAEMAAFVMVRDDIKILLNIARTDFFNEEDNKIDYPTMKDRCRNGCQVETVTEKGEIFLSSNQLNPKTIKIISDSVGPLPVYMEKQITQCAEEWQGWVFENYHDKYKEPWTDQNNRSQNYYYMAQGVKDYYGNNNIILYDAWLEQLKPEVHCDACNCLSDLRLYLLAKYNQQEYFQSRGFVVFDSNKSMTANCIKEGEYVDHPDKDSFECCAGLSKSDARPLDDNCKVIIPENSPGIEPGWTCIQCGDGICNKQANESKCNCPADCKYKEDDKLSRKSIYYETVNNNVYYFGEKINEADAATFVNLDSFGGFAKDKKHVYYFGETVIGADPVTLKFLGGESQICAKDINNVYCKIQETGYNSLKAIEGADLETFNVYLSGPNGCYYAKDKNAVYDCNWSIIFGSDPQSFEFLFYPFAKDKSNIYYVGLVSDMVLTDDVGNFQIINRMFGDGNIYSKDLNNVFCNTEKIPDADASSFDIYYESPFFADKNFVYHNCKKIAGSDGQTFEHVNMSAGMDRFYFRDKYNLYFIKQPNAREQEIVTMKVEDPYSFNYILKPIKESSPDYNYIKNNQSVYYQGSLIDGVDAKTFIIMAHQIDEIDCCVGSNDCPYAKDEYNVYLRGEIDSEANPDTFDCSDIKDTHHFTYFDSGNNFKIYKEYFNIPDVFSPEKQSANARNCGLDKTLEYYQGVFEPYSDGPVGWKYFFQYGRASQGTGMWQVTVIPNLYRYKSVEIFKEDFGVCSAGHDMYPHSLSEGYLLFVGSCGSGYDNGSGLPHGCEEVRSIIKSKILLK